MRRRDFIELAAVLLAGRLPIRADDGVGRVVYCRVSAASRQDAVRWLRREFGEAPLAVDGNTLRFGEFVARYEGRGCELVICGSEATLVVDGSGRRRFL